MEARRLCILVALLALFVSLEVGTVLSQDDDDSSGQKRMLPAPPPPPGSYEALSPDANSGQERAYCLGVGGCQFKTLTCPADCPERKPKKNRRHMGCFVDCRSRCQATCKWRKPDCNEYGSICYDPRFVGGDGVMFYFHGSKGNDFAVVSDHSLHINAHFIGNRPQGRTRDFTWVQALSLMFHTNTLVLAANRVSHWNPNLDALIVKWNGQSITIPTDGEAQWGITTTTTTTTGELEETQVLIERTVDVNTVRATVSGVVQMDIRVTPIGEKENRVHHYQLPSDDAFAHLEVQFRFFNLSNSVEGVLGKTYRAGYVSPVKRGVPMPIMGGEDKYRTPSLYSSSCKLCIFQRPSPAIAVA
ncbi:Late embryogenesis abundant protein-like protein [Perilla frutescens var. hirtella]|uniref:Late embryogenesis abundant protein-like protein n=1 Tax=Perilla frutescens var. hirtella TaxID=608512 RepID=A0AAD4J6J0_PERFH|nr:Late embryogenesis abundant protein-like protein [Perilla frutescens var. hirtella]